jgi:hypothetical protein
MDLPLRLHIYDNSRYARKIFTILATMLDTRGRG